MQDESGVLRRVAWREICPWLIIFRSFRLSISLPVLLLAAAGWSLTPAGTAVANMFFLGDEASSAASWLPHLDSTVDPRGPLVPLAEQPNPIRFVYEQLLSAPASLLTDSLTFKETMHRLVCSLWNLAVWSFFAVAICRIAAVHLGREERVELGSAIRYAARKFGWSLAAPLFPLLGIIIAGLPAAALGLLMQVDAGLFVAAIVWPVALVGGLVMAVLLLGLTVGWPLMWPAISSEHHGDAFEAFSRTYSYVFQRPLHYLFYAVVSALFGSVCWLVVSYMTEGLILLASSAAAWGAGAERIDLLQQKGLPGFLGLGANLVQAFEFVVRVVGVSFNFSFFFCVSTAVYLVLRRDLDQTDFDDVFVEADRERYSLPPLKPNADGVPGASDEPAADSAEVGNRDDEPAS